MSYIAVVTAMSYIAVVTAMSYIAVVTAMSYIAVVTAMEVRANCLMVAGLYRKRRILKTKAV